MTIIIYSLCKKCSDKIKGERLAKKMSDSDFYKCDWCGIDTSGGIQVIERQVDKEPASLILLLAFFYPRGLTNKIFGCLRELRIPKRLKFVS